MKYLLILLISYSNLNSVFALEIDEKLTLRFLKVSNSKKTILINRGSEDGLVMGDHAKFFVTSGVIARGVVEKVSPSRSIWSLYRVVDPAEISDGKVLNLKIASPVKITDDPTKSMKDEPVEAGIDKMEMNAGAPKGESAPSANAEEQKELEDMGPEETSKPMKTETPAKSGKTKGLKEVSVMEEIPQSTGGGISKNWEVWGTLYMNSLSGTVSSSDATSSGATSASASTIDFSAGIERYFLSSEGFLKNISVTALIHKKTIEIGQVIKVTSDWFEFGGGANYHFINSPDSTNRMIGFGALSLGIGNATVKDSYISNGLTTETSIKGTNSFFSGAIGTKYILTNGFGVRALLDYYRSSESYVYPNSITVKRTFAGPRIQLGISYRF